MGARTRNRRRALEEGLARLRARQAADFYRWLVTHFPRSSDPVRHELVAYSVTPRDQLARLRDSIPAGLRERASFTAARELARLAKEFESNSWLRVLADEAFDAAARSTWEPPTVSEFLELTQNRESRLIRTAAELLGFIEDSIERLEARLHGETPAVPDLWNEVRKGLFRPKDEEHLSDYVKRHLEIDLERYGVMAFREVKISPRFPRRRGERTDIHVNVSVAVGGARVRLRAVIEVKGCWNKELKTGLRKQLRERYLERSAKHGLYLVGWYGCAGWDRRHRSRGASPKWSIGKARVFFERQAASASTDGRVVRAYVLNAALE